MKKWIVLALLSASAFAQQPANPAVTPNPGSAHQSKAPAYKAKNLTRPELDALLAHPERILFIDVRRPDEISSIGGFPVYLNIQAGDLKNHLAEIPKDKVIITVSNHAARAGVAADLLTSSGFNVAGAVGVQTYQAAGGTIVKVEVPKQMASEAK